MSLSDRLRSAVGRLRLGTERLLSSFDRLTTGIEVKILIMAAVVGVLGGLGSVGFNALVRVVQTAAMGSADVLEAAADLAWWQKIVIPTAGAAVASLLLYAVGRERETAGVSELMEIVAMQTRRRPSVRVTIMRTLASLGVLATGGSVGREGAIVQVAASVGGGVGAAAGFSGQRLGLLLGCGVASGMAATYNAPVAGAVFAMELVLANFAVDVFAPVVLASVAATTTSRLIVGSSTVYVIPAATPTGSLPVEAATFLVLGILSGVAAVGFMESLARATRAFRAMRLPPWARTTLGGLLIGCIGIWIPHVWGNGYEVVDRILHHQLALPLVGALLLLKILATSISVGSGSPGGVFTPSLFVGAALGLLYGEAAAALFPGLTSSPVVYAIVGMAGLVAGTTRAPIMAVFVLVEMTNDFAIVVPLMLGTIAASATAHRIRGESLYTGKLRERGVRLPVGLEETALAATQVGDLMRIDVPALSSSDPVDKVLGALVASRHDVLFVVDDQGRLFGGVRLHDVKELLAEREVGPLLIAADLAVSLPSIEPEASLAAVLEYFDDPEIGEVPVTEAESGRLLGSLSRRDVIAMLSLEVLGRATRRARFAYRDREESDYVELPLDHKIDRIPVPASVVGKSIAASDFGRKLGLSILMVIRCHEDGREERIYPTRDLELAAGDALLVFGASRIIDRVRSGKAPHASDDAGQNLE